MLGSRCVAVLLCVSSALALQQGAGSGVTRSGSDWARGTWRLAPGAREAPRYGPGTGPFLGAHASEVGGREFLAALGAPVAGAGGAPRPSGAGAAMLPPLVLPSLGSYLVTISPSNTRTPATALSHPCSSSVKSTPVSQVACLGTTAVFMATGTPPGGTYSWSLNDGGTGSTLSAGQNTPVVTVTAGGAAGSATLTVTYTLPGCPSVQDTSTLVVEDRGPCDGVVDPGESIQDEVNAAPPGGLVIVQSGSFSGFTVDSKPLTILGVGMPQITGPVAVTNIGPGAMVAMADLDMNSLDLTANGGCVVVSGARFSEDAATTPSSRDQLVDLQTSADVRASEVTVDLQGRTTSQHALAADGGRVELAEAVVLSADGADGSDDAGGAPAGFGLRVCNGARAHVALSSLTGGVGGKALGYGQGGGDGGAAVQVEGASDLILTGVLPGTRLAGGDGSRALFGLDGQGGDAISLLNDEQPKTVRYSGVGLDPGNGGPSAEDGETIGGQGVPGDVIVAPADDDPSLELLSLPQSNVPFTLRVHAKPGTTVDLLSGTQPQVLDDGLAVIELLVVVTQTQSLGVVPPGGFIDVPITLTTGQGSIRFYQAAVQDGPTLFRTNSVPVLLR